jgi:uncharacterized protein
MITPEGGRVLGSLAEKKLATPQQYPLTLNALSLACNQATNREPVMNLSEVAIQRALDELKGLRLVRFVLPSHGKSVTRYRHVLDETYGLDSSQIALLAVLLLRGPQTPGELRARTGRTATFSSMSSVQDALDALAGQSEPLVRLQPRKPGQKEERWQQLLAAEVDGAAATGEPVLTAATTSGSPMTSTPVSGDFAKDRPRESAGRSDSLESRVGTLESEVTDLRNRIVEFTASLKSLRESLGE